MNAGGHGADRPRGLEWLFRSGSRVGSPWSAALAFCIGMVLLVSACEDTSPTTAPPPAPAPAPTPPPAPSPPGEPANLRVSGSAEDYVEWQWDAVEDADGYEVQFALGQDFTDADEVIDTAGQTIYRRMGLSARTGVLLRVRSYAGTGGERLRSDWTSPLMAATLAPLPPECSDLVQVAFLGRNEAAQTALGELTFEALDGSEAALDFVRPYRVLIPDGGANLDVAGLLPTIGTFVSNLRLVQEDGWFQQTAQLEWLGDLEVRATASGCAPVVVSCDSFSCATSNPSG